MTGKNPNDGLTAWQLFALSFGTIVGLGWITLVGAWLSAGGTAGAIIAFAIAAGAITLIALVYDDLSTRHPGAGGEVLYGLKGFGLLPAFFTGSFLLLVFVSVFAFELISAGWLASTIFPGLRQMPLYMAFGHQVYLGELLVGLAVGALVMAANLRSGEAAISLQTFLTLAKIAGSVAFLAIGFSHFRSENLTPAWGTSDLHPILAVSVLAPFMYLGFNVASQAVHQCSASVSRLQIRWSIAGSVLVAGVFYICIILVTAGLLPRDVLLQMDLPAAAAMEQAFQSTLLRDFILLIGFVGLVTAANALVFAGSRLLESLARIDLAPRFLANGIHRLETPSKAILVFAGVGVILALAGRSAILPLVSIVGFCYGFIWLMMALCAWKAQPELNGKAIFMLGSVFLYALFTLGCAAYDMVMGNTAAQQLSVIVTWSLLTWAAWHMTRAGRHARSDQERAILLAGIR